MSNPTHDPDSIREAFAAVFFPELASLREENEKLAAVIQSLRQSTPVASNAPDLTDSPDARFELDYQDVCTRLKQLRADYDVLLKRFEDQGGEMVALTQTRDMYQRSNQAHYNELLELRGKVAELEQKQCQCVPVLEERLKKLNETFSTVCAERDHKTKRLSEEISRNDKLLARLRQLFHEGLYSNEMFQSNPPMNMVAYQGREILKAFT